MKYLVFVYPGDAKAYEAGAMPSPALLQKMAAYNESLIEAGIMLSGEGLKPGSSATRLSFNDGKPAVVTKGPFDQPLIGGFWIWNVSSEDEAIAWAKRAPMEDGATLELRPVFEMADFGAESEETEKRLQEKLQARHNA